jgi:two-component system sensor histidine kinase BaeS
VALAAVTAFSAVGTLAVNAYEGRDLDRQEALQASAAALGAESAYARHNWSRALSPVMVAIRDSGAAALIRNNTGAVVQQTPGYSRLPSGPERRLPLTSGGRSVGTIAVRFTHRGVADLLSQLNSQRWRARLAGGAIGALLALVVALILARRITAPVERLLRAARAMGGGDRDARIGRVRGFADLRELAAAFDQMADALRREEQVRRNMVADISHELRTPVAVLQASTEAMLDGVRKLTPGQIRSLHDEAMRLGRLVGDLQRLASAEAASLQMTLGPCGLAAPAGAAADSLASVFASAGVTVARQLAPALAWCDERRIYDVITNLLTNAAKFTPAGGQVRIETWQSPGAALLRVSDTGVGIREEDLPRVSERFYRGQNGSGAPGTGIGLAVVDELVRGQHGTVSIASQVGKGTQVTVTLPSARSPGQD